MPYIYEDTLQGEPRNAFELPSSRREVLTEQFAQSFEENPIAALGRFAALADDQVTGPRLPAETARARLKDAGMEHDLKVSDGGITEAALTTLMERKRREKRRQEVFARAEGGFGEGAQRFGVAALTTLADPVSAGLNFVPVVGQARYARWLADAGSIAGRIGVRSAVGALEGTAGAGLAEIPIYAMRTQEQADYDMADSLLNVAFGGVVGAGLHSTVGTAAEVVGGIPERRVPRAAGLSAADRIIERRLAGRVAGDVEGAMREYAELDGAQGGKVLNTDLARELSPEYRADRTRSTAVHEPASYLVKQMYARKLAEPLKEGEDAVVVFSAGGTGAGKSTGLEALSKADTELARAKLIYDTNLNTLKSAVEKIDQALESGNAVRIVYTWRDPVDALVNGALPRAMRMGRTVPINEHARTHVGAAQTIPQLMELYRDDPRVRFDIIDNSHGRGGAKPGSLETIRPLEYDRVREELSSALEAQRASGAISEAVYRGTSDPGRARVREGDDRSPEPGNSTAAERVEVASPDVQQAALRAAVGQAAEGRPVDVDPIVSGLPADISRLLLEPDSELRNAIDQAEITLSREIASGTEANLKAAEEEADLAVAEATELATRLGVDLKEDADFAAVMEGVEKAERWARVAELATVCLVRGG